MRGSVGTELYFSVHPCRYFMVKQLDDVLVTVAEGGGIKVNIVQQLHRLCRWSCASGKGRDQPEIPCGDPTEETAWNSQGRGLPPLHSSSTSIVILQMIIPFTRTHE